MIFTRTPFRVSFFGGGTDYPIWYREHGGNLLATAIDKYCYVTCRRLPPFFDHHSRVAYHRIETVSANREIQQPVVRACLEYLKVDAGVEIHYDADLPGRTGLGTSSAFSVGLLQALYAMQNQLRSRESLARDAVQVEQVLLNEAVGVQDQITAAFGGFNHITIGRDGEFSVAPVCAPPERVAELERHLVLYFTGFARTASEIARHQVAAASHRAPELRQMQAMVPEALDVVHSPRRNLQEFGLLLHEAWMLKRSLTDRIATPQVDEIYEAGIAAGASGGKLLGAGGGGFLLFFVTPDRQEYFHERMRKLLRVPFRFSRQGSQIVLYEPTPQIGSERAAITHGTA